jgi:hypothetical protein
VKVNGLAKPGRLTPAAKTYVVWVQQEGSQAKSQGELKVGNNHKGDLKAATTFHTFNVFVTAETESQTKFPSEQVVLRATVQELERGRLVPKSKSIAWRSLRSGAAPLRS